LFNPKRIDKKTGKKGVVQNKRARHNLCFSEIGQKPEMEKGKGTIIPFKDIPLNKNILDLFKKLLGEKGNSLNIEGNKYYDINKTGIGYHGDSERRKVIAWRLGESMSLHYQWFVRSKPIGNNLKLIINSGDVYIMSEKAVGTDWLKNKKIPTLRHAAGCKNYTIKPIKKHITEDGSFKKDKINRNYILVEKLYNIKTEKNIVGIPIKFI